MNTDREPYRWRTLGLYDIHRARMWQGVICTGVVAAFVGIIALIMWAGMQ